MPSNPTGALLLKSFTLVVYCVSNTFLATRLDLYATLPVRE